MKQHFNKKVLRPRYLVAAIGVASMVAAGGSVVASASDRGQPAHGSQSNDGGQNGNGGRFGQGNSGGPPDFDGQPPAVSGAAIYDSTISPLPADIPSVGVEAYAYNEIGNEINLADSSDPLDNVVVQMASWACQSGGVYTGDCVSTPGATSPVPITFTIYKPGTTPGTVGAVIATRTQTFKIPYRPTHSTGSECTSAGAVYSDPGDDLWYDSANHQCGFGIANNITFDFSSSDVRLPSTVVYGISYNSDNYGPSPLHGSNSFTDSLNVGLTTSSTITTASLPVNPSVGSDTYPGNMFLDSATATNSDLFCGTTTPNTFVGTFVWCDNAEGTTGTTGLVTGLYDVPAVQFNVDR